MAAGCVGDWDIDVLCLRHLRKDSRIDDELTGFGWVDEVVGGVDPESGGDDGGEPGLGVVVT